MQAIPLVRASSLRPFFEFVTNGGGQLHGLRDRIGPVFREAGGLVPVAYGGLLIEEAARATGLDDLGLRIGRSVVIDGFGEWGALIARSATVGAFLQAALASYRAFNTGYRLWVAARGDEAWLHLAYCRALRAGRAHVLDYSLLTWLAAFRAMLGPTWRPREIHLEGEPPRHAGEIAALAAQRVRYRQPTMALGFPRATLARRVEGVRPAPAPAAGELAPPADFVGSVHRTVSALLQLGAAELHVAAEAAGMSERSFQRRLGAQGLTFSDVLEAARFEAARRMLADPAVRVIDVSTELGYSDSANFTRAFRRWTGVPPRTFRRTAPRAPAPASG